MSRLVARILLCILMFPLAVVVFCSTILNLDRFRQLSLSYYVSESLMFLTAGIVTWIFIAIYWTLLWQKSVRWTVRRRLAPIVVAFFGILIAPLAGWFITYTRDWQVKIVLLDILIPSLWLIATVYYWRETPAERAARIHASGRSNVACPTCGYNLTGLAEARCPECGSKFTLDELFATQSQQPVGEIE